MDIVLLSPEKAALEEPAERAAMEESVERAKTKEESAAMVDLDIAVAQEETAAQD